jgi:ABC-type uncharacterized transport system ATPase subunit
VYDVANITTKEMASLMVGYDFETTLVKDSRPMGAESLSVEHLSYVDDDGVKRVDDVSFTVREGEILAVAGVAGNGQVEVADMVAGLLSPDVRGHPVQGAGHHGSRHPRSDRTGDLLHSRGPAGGGVAA